MLRFLKKITNWRGKLAWIASISLVIIIFATSSMMPSYASSSRAILPVAKGGTGINGFSPNKALIGNDTNSIQTTGIDTTPTQNSNNLITSGAVFNTFSQSDLTVSSVIDINTNQFQGGHDMLKARKLGRFILLQGPILFTKSITPKTSYTIGTFQTGYKPYGYVAATCSNNFAAGDIKYGGGTIRFDCGVDGDGNLKLQAGSSGSVPVGAYVDINFLYLIGG
ncbi:MAG: hypothetical protein LBT99_04550 [Bifidobacteriaceae bacterium]|jgi:hypothetical protein|nr:hypothetical protein [Bifidobacteriaceae bacterium]